MRLLQVLTIEQFEQWLKSFNENEIVGIARKDNSCPIATYLKSKNFSNPSVTETEVYGQDKESNFFNYLEFQRELDKDSFEVRQLDNFSLTGSLPFWVVEFVEILDDKHSGFNYLSCSVEAKTALDVLATLR